MILPGAGYGGAISLNEIVENKILQRDRIILEIINELVYVNKKQLQGIKIVKNSVYISGVHYTSWEAATQIKSMKRIEPSLNDPFVYISEPGKMSCWSEELIKKELGSLSAGIEVKLTVVVPVSKVWIKISRFVAHYAISGVLSKEIIRINIQKRKS